MTQKHSVERQKIDFRANGRIDKGNMALLLVVSSLLFFMLFIPKHWIIGLTNKKSLSIIVFIATAAILQALNRHAKVRFDFIDLVFITFVLWNFGSFFWATNPALIWDKAFSWLFIYIVYKVTASLDFSSHWKRSFLLVMLCALSFNLIVLTWFFVSISNHGASFGFSFLDLQNIARYLGHNSNSIASILVMTMPLYLILAYESKINKHFISGLAIYQSAMVVGLNCRGALLALFFQVLIFVFVYLKMKRKIFWPLIIGAALSASTLIFVENRSEFIKQYNPLKGLIAGHDERLLLWEASLKVFKDNMLTGSGAGNWMIDAPKYGQKFFYGFDSFAFLYHPHSIYFDLLAELGLPGFLLYLGIIGLMMILIIKNIRRSNSQHVYFAVFLSLIAFLVTSGFYGVVYATHRFSVFQQVFLFFLFGVATSLDKIGAKQKNLLHHYFGLAFIGVLLYAGYYQYKSHKVLLSHKYLRLRNKLDYQQVTEKIEEIYNPNFYNILKQRHVPVKALYALDLWALGREAEAVSNMKLAILDQPNHHFGWFHLGNMYRGLCNSEEAIVCYEKVYSLKDSFFKAQINLVGEHIKAEHWAEAKKWHERVSERVDEILYRYESADAETKKKQQTDLLEKCIQYKKQLNRLSDQLDQKGR
jgi:O-antigen ligase